MNNGEIRARSTTDLRGEIVEKEKEIFNLRFRKASEKAADPSRIRTLRKDMARLLTVIRERELDVRGQASHAASGQPRGGKAAR
jgi:large subunit ribosomal protein L29